ncbi:hypothetical protein SKAU_G00003730 [Synaphobranchus kaupii]|uniref:Uncharacterized protein n=1 Tax=Synaphobranchus kaupii TaxID=118154 RepID=A0A9Q1G8R6_SYNKA|nr:hypothetical protein SKAU_G00003730 [Synaphobranchus kaupii]
MLRRHGQAEPGALVERRREKVQANSIKLNPPLPPSHKPPGAGSAWTWPESDLSVPAPDSPVPRRSERQGLAVGLCLIIASPHLSLDRTAP